jgi:S1-C subfamily serine protease
MSDQEEHSEGAQPGDGWPAWGSGWPPPGEGGWGQQHHGWGHYGPGGYPGYQGGGWGWGSPYGPPGYHYPAPPRRRRRLPAALTALAVIVAVALGVTIGHDVWNPQAAGSSGFGSGNAANPSNGGIFSTPFGSGNNGSSGNPSSNGGPSDVGAIAAKIDPALVDVNVTFSYQRAAGAGTGIVLTPNGEVLTNNHVVDGATKISVTDVGNGKTYNASVVGYDSTHDVAVIQLQHASGLATAKVNTSTPSIGEAVVAVGNAGGQGGTPTSAGGSVTALNQSISASDELDGTSEQLAGLIQTNADIQSGDSGGSMVNAKGQVIGMDTAATQSFSFSTQSATQGFAIPIGQALSIAKQIVSGHGTSTIHVGPTAFLGVLIDPTGSQGGSNGSNPFGGGTFGGGTGTTSGAYVQQAVSGGAAAQAGITGGDTITSLGGHPVDTSTTLSHLLVPDHPGQKVSIGWVDSSGQSHTGTVTLGSGPPA